MARPAIFITGGNAGIGLATSLLFAREGHDVAIVGRRAEQNRLARAEIEAAGARCLDLAGDVTDEDFLRAAVRRTAEEFGGLRYAFNNAGVEQALIPLPGQSIEDYRRVMDVNVLGVWLAMREEIPVIQASGGGCVVNTSSVAGLVGLARAELYVAAKHAVIGLTKSAALEYAPQGVRVNAVCPGVVRTDLFERLAVANPDLDPAALHPMGRVGAAGEVASAVLYLCRDATWTTGQALAMDGGWTVA